VRELAKKVTASHGPVPVGIYKRTRLDLHGYSLPVSNDFLEASELPCNKRHLLFEVLNPK